MNAISSEVWDPFGTLHNALWIGGGQWAGKSTVARLLATRYGLTAYHYDYHDARAHNDRRIARRVRLGEPIADPDPDTLWVNASPQEMADETLAGFPARFEWALDDLRGLVSGRPVIAEGWGLRPELVAPIIDSPWRMIVMVPSEEFRRRQVRRHRPHVSLTVAKTLDPINLDELGTFPSAEGVLFVGVTGTAELLTFHKRVHPALPDTQIKHWPDYLPSKWIPHCTLAVGLDRMEFDTPIPDTYGTDSACCGQLA